jgi:menaquinone-dependent protoporphyrinogen oxidase
LKKTADCSKKFSRVFIRVRTTLKVTIEYENSSVSIMKTLIVYATRYGATTGTAEEIAKVLREEGFDVKVVNAKEEKIKDIAEYELVIVGSGLQMFKWTGEAEGFLKKFQKDLAKKKVALFVSSMKKVYEREGKKDEIEKAWKRFLEDKATKYGLHPISMGMFGGVIDYNKMNMIIRRTMGAMKQQLEADGFKENPAGVYDTRDWQEIHDWAKNLVLKARYL